MEYTACLLGNFWIFFVTLIATTPEDCVDDISVGMLVNLKFELYVPNVFTRAPDYLNDVFQIFYLQPVLIIQHLVY